MGAGPSFRPSSELYPFDSRWFDSSAGRVHYVDEGSGQPLLLLHGNPTWSFLYRNVIRELTDAFRCVAVDYPGFGLSDRPEGYGYTPAEHAAVVGELVDQLGLGEMIVMGHDWGGPIGTSVAAERSDRVAGLVLGNTWFWKIDRLRPKVFARVMSSPPLQWLILHRNQFVGFIPKATERKLTEVEMDHYRAVQPSPQMRRGVAEFPRQILAAGEWLDELERRVGRELSGKRTLITWPMRDPAFDAEHDLPRVRAAFDQAEVVELENASHYFQEDAPQEVASAIRRCFAAG